MRELTNTPGAVYNAGNTQTLFAEDWNELYDLLNAAIGLIYFVSGKVGIGTDDPEQLLHLLSEATTILLETTNAANAAQLSFITPNKYISFGSNEAAGSDGGAGFYDNTAEAWRFFISHLNGDIGIGTDAPQAKLDVQGGAANLGFNAWCNQNTGGFWLSSFNDYLIGFYRNEAGDAFIRTNYTERIAIKADGKVGIGVSDPGSALSVAGLPTSASGLSAGDIWVDTSAGNVLKIVT